MSKFIIASEEKHPVAADYADAPGPQFGGITTENWLKDEVLPVIEARRVDPGRGRTPEQVLERLSLHTREAAELRR